MDELKFAATGDSIITRRVSARKGSDFAELVDLVRSADAAFTNLEIMTPRRPWVPSSEYGGMHLAAPPFILDELRWFGFNLFNVANNHSTDYTFQGLLDTLEELERRDMVYAGGGRTLGEARSPGYLETPAGRVALIGAASSFMTGALAAENRTDVGGRPGINPLRFETEYVLDAQRLAWIQEIDRVLGTQAVAQRRREFGLLVEDRPGTYLFLGHHFAEGDEPRVRTRPKARDLEEIARWIGEARRQADLVVVSLHAHEGQNGDSNSATPADFIVEAARYWIDAGADVFVGHGPHMLRAVEIYKGKPIFYSLGNFMFMFETVWRLPSEMYERHDMGPEATPADVYDAWSSQEDGSPKAFHTDPRFWESVVPICRFAGGRATAIELHPVTLGLHEPRTRRGEPVLASAADGERVLTQLAELSAPFGTEIDIAKRGDRVAGIVRL